MLDFDQAIRELESFWDSDHGGVFWELRQGKFVEKDVISVAAWLERCHVEGAASLPRRFVSLLWYIPLFLDWQKERVVEAGGDSAAYERVSNLVANQVERILGVP
jgi:hypothetical protein